MIKQIFWDNDGVLVDTEKYYYQAITEILSDVGLSLTQEDFREYSLVKGTSVFDFAVEKGFSEKVVSELKKKRNNRYEELITGQNTLINGVSEVLSKLHGKVFMSVVTSSLRNHFNILHKRTNILKYFEFIIVNEDTKLSKPHPDPYLLALEKSGFDSEDCMVIEDTQRGLEAATAAGIKCCVIPTELSKGSDFSKAHKVLNSVSEVCAEFNVS